MRLGSALFLVAAGLPGFGQAPRPIVSPEVHADRSVTFRFRAPNAEKVFLRLEGAKSLLMQKNDDGIWNVTIEPVEPDYYGYSFIVDGVNLSDPSTSAIRLSRMICARPTSVQLLASWLKPCNRYRTGYSFLAPGS